MNIFMLMMGGSGRRFGSERPKQYIEVLGQPIFSYILEKCNSAECIDEIVIVSNEKWIDYVREWIEKLCINKCKHIVPGGNTRSESVKNGLVCVRDHAAEKDIVLIHDATHPYFEEQDVFRLIDAINEYGAATLVQRQYDTVYRINDESNLVKVVPREYIVSGASPEGFHFGIISEIYLNADKEELSKMTSAGAMVLARGIQMKSVSMTGINLKLTYPEDMEVFKMMAKAWKQKEDQQHE